MRRRRARVSRRCGSTGRNADPRLTPTHDERPHDLVVQALLAWIDRDPEVAEAEAQDPDGRRDKAAERLPRRRTSAGRLVHDAQAEYQLARARAERDPAADDHD